MTENQTKKEEEQPAEEVSKIWQEILSESAVKKENENTNIFIFGDNSTGKKSIIRAMNKEVDTQENNNSDTAPQKNFDGTLSRFGLIDYELLSVKKPADEDTEIETINKIGVWIANELIDKDTFLTFVKPEDILNSICLIVVDYSRPWLIIQSIEKWANFYYDTFSALLLKLSFDVQTELRNKSKKIYLT